MSWYDMSVYRSLVVCHGMSDPHVVRCDAIEMDPNIFTRDTTSVSLV